METLDPHDVPPNLDTGSDDVAPLRCQHEGCQNSLTYSGRGRKPKFCDEHKPTGNKSSGKIAGWSAAATVQAQLTLYLTAAGAGVKFINPYDGKIIAEGGPAVAREVVRLAATKHRNWRRPLEIVCTPGEYGPLMIACASLVLPILANHGFIPGLVIPMLGMEMPPANAGKDGPNVVDFLKARGGVAG